jgi:hypothetical protein
MTLRQLNPENVFILLLVVAVLATLLLPAINAEQQSFGTFKQGECINLIQTCANCSYINITVTNPNSTVIISNQLMTKTGTIYNYSFCNTTILGQYIYNTLGDTDGIRTTVPVNFIITPSGFQVSIANTVIMFFIVGVLILITVVMFYFGLSVKNKALMFFFISGSVLLTVFIIGYILNMVNVGLGEFSGISNLFNSFYYLMIILLVAGSVAAIVWVMKFAFEQFYKLKGYDFGDAKIE